MARMSPDSSGVDLSVVMPCLNEAETLAACIEKARLGIEASGVTGEILVADNGSTDGSIALAGQHGARVVSVPQKGYGNALRGGIDAARGRWIIMGDADDSYDFSQAPRFVEKLRAGFDLVMGCRLPAGGGEIQPGAMPWKNRWIGNPTLSFLGRLFFRTPIRDFHCGLRAFTREAYKRMDLQTTGMEFASEMVMKASLQGMRVSEVPITLHRDGRSRPPHLRPWRDGWRHLRFMLIYSPRWLFLAPGMALSFLGAITAFIIYLTPVHVGDIDLDAGTLVVACMALIVGLQFIALATFSKAFAIENGLLPPDPDFHRWMMRWTLEKGLITGLLVFLGGIGFFAWAVFKWIEVGLGDLPYEENLRRIMASATCVVVGLQLMGASWFLSVLGLKTRPHA
jgi:glycosyltransferase involved in cell wall biosynthesis